MPTTYNILSDYSALRAKSSVAGQVVQISTLDEESTWSVTGGTISYVPTELISTSRYVLRIAPATSNPITINLLNEEIRKGYSNRVLSFNCKIKPGAEVTTSTLLQIVNGTVESPHVQNLSGGVYGAIQSNKTKVPNSSGIQYANISITISNHEGKNIFLTMPNLIDDEAFYENYYVSACRNFLPDFYWEIDSQQEFPTAPYFRLIDILSTTLNDVRKEYKAMFEYERMELDNIEQTFAGYSKSTLTNPSIVNEEYMVWLSQFTGNKLTRNLTQNDGSVYFDNRASQRAFTEWQLSESHYGRAAGTREALYQSIQQVLNKTKDNSSSTKSVAITPFFNNDRWSIRISTLANETPDSSVGGESNLVKSAAEAARPLGYKIFHTTVDVFAFILNDITYGRLDEISIG